MGGLVALLLAPLHPASAATGIDWTAGSAAAANSWRGVTYGNGLFVAVSSSATDQVMTSPNGITWTPRTSAANNSWRSVTYGNGLFVAVSNSGANRVMIYAPRSFAPRAPLPAQAPSGIFFTSRAGRIGF